MKSLLLLGAGCLVTAELLFAGVGAMVKHLSAELSQSQLVFFRNLAAMLVLLPWLFASGPDLLRTRQLKLHIFRACTGLAGMYCFFYVLANMPLAPAMMALHTAPFFVPLIAKLWLKETISRLTLIAIGIGFFGVILVLKPDSGQFNLYAAIAMLCAFLVAVTKCTLRKLSDTEPSVRIVVYFTGLATLVSFFPMLFAWQPISWQNWLWISLMGFCAAFGQLLMTKAFQLASPVSIGLLTYTSVLFASALGYLVWQESVPNGLMLGMLMILLAANLSVRQRWLL